MGYVAWIYSVNSIGSIGSSKTLSFIEIEEDNETVILTKKPQYDNYIFNLVGILISLLSSVYVYIYVDYK